MMTKGDTSDHCICQTTENTQLRGACQRASVKNNARIDVQKSLHLGTAIETFDPNNSSELYHVCTYVCKMINDAWNKEINVHILVKAFNDSTDLVLKQIHQKKTNTSRCSRMKPAGGTVCSTCSWEYWTHQSDRGQGARQDDFTH